MASGLAILSLSPFRTGPQLPVLQRCLEMKLRVSGPVLSLIPDRQREGGKEEGGERERGVEREGEGGRERGGEREREGGRERER